MSKNNYIPEIDFFRALCVVGVVIFHYFPSFLPGGYIGVDVFFVISGFVISRAYLFPLIEKKRSLKDFYIARFRRLAPALFLVVLVTSLSMLCIAIPSRLVPFAESVLAQTFYVQNFVFWFEGDYWGGAGLKPLLHTWSLAVEEQFYLLWALLIMIFRPLRKLIVPALILMTFVSLAGGLFLEPRSPKTVFFMLPTRVWEFTLGILAFLFSRNLPSQNKLISSGLVYICIILMIASAVLFDEKDTFPGPQAYLACMTAATALFFLNTSSDRIPGLNMKPVLDVGRVSYGFYLWHWPPIALFYIANGYHVGPFLAIVFIVTAYICAWLSYHFYEEPIRRKRVLSSSSGILKFYTLGSVALIASSLFIIMTNGFLNRYPAQIRPYMAAYAEKGPYRCSKLYVLQNSQSEVCPLNAALKLQGQGVLILGDSHADVLDEKFSEIGSENNTPIYLTTRNCDLGRYGTTSFCSRAVRDKIARTVKALNVNHVIAISFWETGLFSKESFLEDVKAFTDLGISLSVMEVVPHKIGYVPSERALEALSTGKPLNTEGVSREHYEVEVKAQREIFNYAAKELPTFVRVFSPSELLCDKVICKYEANGVPLYTDNNHLSLTGADHIRPLLESMINMDIK